MANQLFNMLGGSQKLPGPFGNFQQMMGWLNQFTQSPIPNPHFFLLKYIYISYLISFKKWHLIHQKILFFKIKVCIK